MSEKVETSCDCQMGETCDVCNPSDFEEDFKREHGKISRGKHQHFCPDWDFMAIDDTCKEFEVCTCKRQ